MFNVASEMRAPQHARSKTEVEACVKLSDCNHNYKRTPHKHGRESLWTSHRTSCRAYGSAAMPTPSSKASSKECVLPGYCCQRDRNLVGAHSFENCSAVRKVCT
eukprot:3037323-Amphidinium_carterae.1